MVHPIERGAGLEGGEILGPGVAQLTIGGHHGAFAAAG